MPNFNDVYLQKYKVLDYGLICKNNSKWVLVSVASGLGTHLNRLFCHFSCHSVMFIKYGALGSFLCVLDLHHPPPLSLFSLSSLLLSLYAMPKVNPRKKAMTAMRVMAGVAAEARAKAAAMAAVRAAALATMALRA